MAKNKMIICDHCGEEIAASAKACPKCGAKIKKPFYKKVWFWILIKERSRMLAKYLDIRWM